MISFLADADLNKAIVSGCKRIDPGIDFLTSHAAGLHGLPDLEVLAIASEHGRILVSHDLKTMPRHFGAFIEAGGSSPGLLLVQQYSSIGEVIDDLVLIWAASDSSEWRNRFVEIPL